MPHKNAKNQFYFALITNDFWNYYKLGKAL